MITAVVSPTYPNGVHVSDLPEVLATAVIGPHDRLIIVLPVDTSKVQGEMCRDAVVELWPDASDRVLFVAGAQQLIVLKESEPSPSPPPRDPPTDGLWLHHAHGVGE